MATTTIDPRLPKPPVDGLTYTEEEIAKLGEELESIEIVTSPNDVTYDYVSDPNDALLLPPSNVTVISQTVKVVAGGQTTVDVVLEIEEVSGAVEYEGREATA